MLRLMIAAAVGDQLVRVCELERVRNSPSNFRNANDEAKPKKCSSTDHYPSNFCACIEITFQASSTKIPARKQTAAKVS